MNYTCPYCDTINHFDHEVPMYECKACNLLVKSASLTRTEPVTNWIVGVIVWIISFISVLYLITKYGGAG